MKSKKKPAKTKKITVKAKKTSTKKTQGAKAGSAKDPIKKKAPKTVKAKESTHIIGILDRSGSMSSVAKDAIGGFNSFITEQKKLKDKATFSGVLFDHEYIEMYDGKVLDIQDVPVLTDQVFIPRGTTALYDAIGRSVKSYKAKLAAAPKKNEKVLVLIITDGANNASTEFTAKDIADMISYQKTQGWQFVFLCSTEDAYKVGANLNVDAGNTFKFSNDAKGNQKLYKSVAFATANYRGMSMDYLNSEEGVLRSANLMADVKDDDES